MMGAGRKTLPDVFSCLIGIADQLVPLRAGAVVRSV
jgi:hypothetical protein